MITVANLTVRAGSFSLQSVSFHIPTGGYAALMGKTGIGKTTILEAICGLRRITSGTINLMDRLVTHLPPAQRGLGYVPQDRALFSTMTVWEHLAFALTVRQWSDEAIATRVDELADLLGLEKLIDRLPHGLSGGEAQRVALGRALSCHPPILLLDEPLSALDDETREEMYELLHSVRRRTGVTTLHVTHHLNEAKRLADQLLVLQNGVIEDRSLAFVRQTE